MKLNRPLPLAVALGFSLGLHMPLMANDTETVQAESPSLPEVIVEATRNVIVAAADGLTKRGEISIVSDVQQLSPDGFSSSVFTQMGSPARRVVGSPYSAEIVTERVQILPDGNQISRKQSQMVYRDSEGRTRQERIDGNGRSTVIISDPVAKTRHMLSPSRRWAYQIPSVDIEGMLSKVRAEGAAAIEKVAKDAKGAKGDISLRINDGEARVKTITLSANGKLNMSTSGDGTTAPTEKRIDIAEIFRFDGADGIGGALRESFSALSPLVGGLESLEGLPPLGNQSANVVSKALGSRDFSGVRADGKLTTRTIAAGSIGNRAPINVTSESWYSPDLQITLYSKHSDPRYGDTVYRVNNLQRGEPSADLFKVPADYTVRGRANSSSSSNK